ncbi:MAG: soluble NSF attachment family protein, partial [Anaerolineae bacterium]|nr:soluble NSF attachment family protein [Anaerolineae bacterium]
MTKDELIELLYSAADAQARRLLLGAHPGFLQIDTVSALKERADLLEQDDARQALHLGLIAEEIAEMLSSDEARALASWTQANAYDFLAENESAVRCYERAAELFNAAGKPLEAARTAIGQMFTLMQLGQFEQSQKLAQSARLVFIEQGDVLSLAKVDMNLGNLHYQQGKYAQALEDYKQATEAFESLGETLYGAMNQINQATALTMLDDFLAAEHLHEQARPVFEEADLRTAAASVDYDLALLQYARGNYAESFRTFERARAIFSSLDLQVNLAMSDLAESDLYLDLNLPGEA